MSAMSHSKSPTMIEKGQYERSKFLLSQGHWPAANNSREQPATKPNTSQRQSRMMYSREGSTAYSREGIPSTASKS